MQRALSRNGYTPQALCKPRESPEDRPGTLRVDPRPFSGGWGWRAPPGKTVQACPYASAAHIQVRWWTAYAS